MEHDSIGIVAAMPEEVRPIIRKLGAHRKEREGPNPVYTFRVDSREITLIESGMGVKKAAAATERLIARATPRVIISAGFGGGLRKGLAVGDVVIADQGLTLDQKAGTITVTTKKEAYLPVPKESRTDCPFRVVDGTMVTTRSIVSKDSADRLIAKDAANPVLDMETSAVAQTAARHGIPLVAVRAISDAAEEELLFSLEEITDRELNIRIGKVLVTIAKKPRILPQMLRLARNAKLAGENLAIFLERLVATV